jgi:hypothetical protein
LVAKKCDTLGSHCWSPHSPTFVVFWGEVLFPHTVLVLPVPLGCMAAAVTQGRRGGGAAQRVFSAAALEARARWHVLEMDGAPRLSQVGAIASELEVAVGVGGMPARVAGGYGTPERAAFEGAVHAALCARCPDIVSGSSWLHRGQPFSSLRVQFVPSGRRAAVVAAMGSLQAEGLAVRVAGGQTHTVPCVAVPARRPGGCVTVKLSGMAGSDRQGAVSELLRAAGYGQEASVAQEFWGANPPVGGVSTANTSIVLAYVTPPEGDEGLSRLPTAVPGMGGSAQPTRISVEGADEVTQVRDFLRSLGRQARGTAATAGAGPSSRRAGERGRAEVRHEPGGGLSTPGGAALGSIPGAAPAAPGGSGDRRLPVSPSPAAMQVDSDADPARDQQDGALLETPRVTNPRAAGRRALPATNLAATCLDWVMDTCDPERGRDQAAEVVQLASRARASLFRTYSGVSRVGDLPAQVVTALTLAAADCGCPAPAAYDAASSEDDTAPSRKQARMDGSRFWPLMASATPPACGPRSSSAPPRRSQRIRSAASSLDPHSWQALSRAAAGADPSRAPPTPQRSRPPGRKGS